MTSENGDAPVVHSGEEGKDVELTPMGDHLPYENYTTIDWLHDLVLSHSQQRALASTPYRRMLYNLQPWITVIVAGLITACIAFVVDVAEASVSDWKEGFCSTALFADKRRCCESNGPTIHDACVDWVDWSESWSWKYGIYVVAAVAYGILAACITATTKMKLPQSEENSPPKFMYMASGSGIPELKTFISGFVIPSFLTVKVLVVKSIGAIFAVATGMCLAKEGPFVHMSACVANVVACLWPRYRQNEAERRGIISAGCAAGLSVAFGAPIGGVLFSFEEISTYFPRRILHLAFLCSLVAGITLVSLNPNGTGSLVLFPTSYATRTTISPARQPSSLAVAVLLGICGGVYGALFCKCNFRWAKWFRSFKLIKNHPVLEAALITLLTAVIQYPNPLVRTAGDETIKALLVDCTSSDEIASPSSSLICRPESQPFLFTWLIHGLLAKLILTIITFGVKVPSGIIIPSLDAGALFGRLLGQYIILTPLPGAYAIIGAAAFLAGVTRMTVSLAVIMLELTGELESVVPHMIAILTAKWVADALEPHGIYDLAQLISGHPFLDKEAEEEGALASGHRVRDVLPDEDTMKGITLEVDEHGCVTLGILRQRVALLHKRGLLDAGLAIVRLSDKGHRVVAGYIAQGDLDQSVPTLSAARDAEIIRIIPVDQVNFAPRSGPEPYADLSAFLDRTPLVVDPDTPLDVLTEMFAKLGLRYMIVADKEGSLTGVVIKKRLVAFLDEQKHNG